MITFYILHPIYIYSHASRGYMTNYYYYYYYYYFTSTGLLIIRVKHIWVDLELSTMYVSMTPIHERKMITFLFFFSKFDFYI